MPSRKLVENSTSAKLKGLQEAYGEAMLEVRVRRKAGIPAGKGRELMLSVQQGLMDESVTVPITKLCQWFGVACRTMSCKATKGPAKVNSKLAEPIREMLGPSFGYRAVAALMGMSKTTVQRIFQLKGWQVRKRPLG